MVTPAGFEPAIFWMRTRYPKPLDDGATVDITQKLYHNRGRKHKAPVVKISVIRYTTD